MQKKQEILQEMTGSEFLNPTAVISRFPIRIPTRHLGIFFFAFRFAPFGIPSRSSFVPKKEVIANIFRFRVEGAEKWKYG
jgi:hypothetical protein